MGSEAPGAQEVGNGEKRRGEEEKGESSTRVTKETSPHIQVIRIEHPPSPAWQTPVGEHHHVTFSGRVVGVIFGELGGHHHHHHHHKGHHHHHGDHHPNKHGHHHHHHPPWRKSRAHRIR